MVMIPERTEAASTAVVNEMYEAAAVRRTSPRNYLGMSVIGERCPRNLWYTFRGYSASLLTGRAAMIFDMGNRVEEAVLHWLDAAGYRVEDAQKEFSAHAGMFRGHCDGIIHGVTSRPHILEIKSANDRRFKAFQREGIRSVSPAYYCQAQCYMGYAGLERALFVVMNKNTCDLYAERMHFSRDDFEALHARAYTIITANEPPERLPDFQDTNCAWCDFRTVCTSPGEAIQMSPSCGCCAGLVMRGLTPICIFQDGEPIIDWNRQPALSCKAWYFRDLSDIPFQS